MDADPLDHAATVTQEAAGREIKRIRTIAARIDTSNPSCECWHCEQITGNQMRWCSFECMDEWSAENG